MSTSKPEYVQAADGLAARVVGPWVVRKVHYVDRFATIFATGMKNKWPRRGYVELFAGPGCSFDRVGREFIAGSAVRALDREFTHYAFVDVDPRAAYALRERIRRAGKAEVARVFQRDCNDAVQDIRNAIPPNALTLVFADPTNWQVKFSTIAALVERRTSDLLMTFHAGSMLRMAGVPMREIDEFFGTGGWRDALKRPRWERVDALLRLYNEQLQTIGYLPSWDRVPVTNTRNVAMYQLVAFSRDPKGVEFWQKAIAGADERGQRRLWD